MQILAVFFVTITLLLWHHKSRAYFELIEELGCHDTEFRLSCGTLKANIAIFEAIFTQNDTYLEPLHTSCGNPGHPTNKTAWKLYKLREWDTYLNWKNNSNGVIEVNFRHSINRRCSGVNYCSFILSEDFEAASKIGPGAVYLRYACVDDVHITRSCNAVVDVSLEGFVRTPGYPEYYVGETVCHWILKASSSQKVKVTFLDVSLRSIAPLEPKCLDWLIVSIDGLNLLSTCGDVLEDTVITSNGPAINVTFKSSSKLLFPKRGFLFHYKAIGCIAPRKPRDGFLISRNDTYAHYRCILGFIFPDTKSRDKILNCYNENTWDGDVLDCVNLSEVFDDIKLVQNRIFLNGSASNTTEKSKALTEGGYIEDIIVPSLLIALLIVGNSIVILFIYLARRKHDETWESELKTYGETYNRAKTKQRSGQKEVGT